MVRERWDLYRYGGMKDGSYVAAPVWTGFYAGINGGGDFGASENIRVTNDSDYAEADIANSTVMAASAAVRSVTTGPVSVGATK